MINLQRCLGRGMSNENFLRLKSDENSRLSLNWNLNWEISKLNDRIHMDAIKEKLILPELTSGHPGKLRIKKGDR